MTGPDVAFSRKSDIRQLQEHDQRASPYQPSKHFYLGQVRLDTDTSDLFGGRHLRMVNVLMASTAASMYFPHAVIKEGSAYVDGGLWANDPSMVASLRYYASGRRPTAMAWTGAMWWAPQLFNISSVAQSQGINFQAQYILGDRLRRIDYDLPDGRWSLDSVEMLAEMAKIGHERSSENLAALRPIYFDQKAQHPYQPFSDVVPAATQLRS